MSTFFIKQNDTVPALRATLKDGRGNVIDLTSASINFHMKDLAGTVKIDAAATIISPASDGIVQYNWTGPDTDTAGTYYAEFEVTYSDGTIESFPNDGNIGVLITKELN